MKKNILFIIGISSLFSLAVKVIASPLDGDIQTGEKANAKSVQSSYDESSVKRALNVAPFPGVYYTVAPQEDAQSEEMVMFVAELDFQGATFIGESLVRVSYIVRDEDEYDGIETMNPYDNMDIDLEETAILQAFANPQTVAGQSDETIDGFPCYRNIDGMFNFMDDLVDSASNVENLVVEKIDIGDSWEKSSNPNQGDDIFAMKVTGEGVAANCLSTEKGIAFITCGVHAREYAPPELCARWLEYLIDGYGNDADVTSILDHTEIHVILESNPDGRRIAENNPSLLWRKNTRPGCFFSFQRGVDLNRNFPFKWGVPGGSSGNKCNPTYRGSGPASEPEVQAITGYAESVFPVEQRQLDPDGADLDVPFPEDTTNGVALDIHSYGDLLIWPFGYEERYCANEEEHNAFARKLKHFNGYALAGPFQPDFLYPASGVTDDYFYKVLGATSFTYELGTEFYQDCGTFENAIFPDNIPSLTYFARVARRPYSLVKGPDVVSLTIPGVIDYSTPAVTLEGTVSDDYLSAGPGSYPPSTQNVASITYSFDMHPYDVDPAGNGPVLGFLPVTSDSTTVSSSDILSVSEIIGKLKGPLNGEHTVYMYGTDADGYDGPVTAASFVLQNVPDDMPEPPTDCLCTEDPNAVIIGQLNGGGATFVDCGTLAANPSFIPSVCGLDPFSVALSLSPAVQCPVTCGDPTAVEDPNSEIIGLTSGPDVVTTTCGVLANTDTVVIDVACNLDISEWNEYAASSVCCDTCA